MTAKILLVGQLPASHKGEPFAGAAGRRLAALAGLEHKAFLDRFERINLLPSQSKVVDVHAARERADQLRESWRGRKAVLLGRGVAGAFRLVRDDYSWFKPIEIPPGVEVAVMPLPDGISQWWNEPGNVEAAREFMLRARLGFLATRKKNGSKERFSVQAVAAALEAGRGVYTWAAEALAEETGLSCTYQTISNYIAKYPELGEISQVQVSQLLDRAKKNIIADVEAGGIDSSWKVLRSKIGQGSGLELVVNAKVDGKIEHDHKHEVTVRIEQAAARVIDAVNHAGTIIHLPKPRSG